MADLNTALDTDDRVLVVRRNSDGVGEPGSIDAVALQESLQVVSNATAHAPIADVATTGVYADDDDALVAAINGILAILRTAGLLTP